MSTLLGVLAAVYGGSMLIIAGGSLVWVFSSRFGRTAGENLETD